MSCVNGDGSINLGKFPYLRNWNPQNNIEGVMMELRKEMHAGANRNLPQPNEGDTY